MSIFLFDDDNDNPSKINIDELYEKQQRKDQKQISIFNKILNRIHNKIKITGRSRTGDRYIWFTVPEFIFGEPVYQQSDCIAYLVDKLEENKFVVRYMHPNTLFVSWAHFVPSYVRNEVKKKLGLILNETGQVVDKLDHVKEEDMNERMFSKPNEQQKKDSKNYTPLTEYKPTGTFVYDKVFFEKMEKKIG